MSTSLLYHAFGATAVYLLQLTVRRGRRLVVLNSLA